MTITDYFLSKTQRLSVEPEITPGDHGFRMFNSGSTEVEVSEFLYSLVRLIKPKSILETGTHYGVSSAYMGQGLLDNGSPALLTTLEINPVFFTEAAKLHDELGLAHWVRCLLLSSDAHTPAEGIDLLFLDSEPHLRFNEFLRYWKYVQNGGFILVHDLHPHLGHTGQIVNGMYDWPYGDFRETIGHYIRRHQVQTVSFRTPRGFTLFQKAADDFSATRLLTGDLSWHESSG